MIVGRNFAHAKDMKAKINKQGPTTHFLTNIG